MVCLHNTYGRQHLCTTCSYEWLCILTLSLSLSICVLVCARHCHNIASKTTPKTVFICNLLCQWLYCYFRRQHIHFLSWGLPELSSIKHCFAFALSRSLYFISRYRRRSIYFIENPTRNSERFFLPLSLALASGLPFPAKSDFMFVVLLWIMFCNIRWTYLMYERIYLFILVVWIWMFAYMEKKKTVLVALVVVFSSFFCKMDSASPSKW